VQTAGEREGEMGGAEAGRQEAERVGKEERSRGDKGARGVWGVKGAQGGSVSSHTRPGWWVTCTHIGRPLHFSLAQAHKSHIQRINGPGEHLERAVRVRVRAFAGGLFIHSLPSRCLVAHVGAGSRAGLSDDRENLLKNAGSGLLRNENLRGRTSSVRNGARGGHEGK
jgi:hypothetical protein